VKIKKIKKRKIVGMAWLASCAILLITPASAIYNFDGIPLNTTRHETIKGGIYINGGHGLKSSPYTQTFNNVPSSIKYARLYVGVWGGNPEYTGTLQTTFNSNDLGTLNLGGQADTNPNVYVSGYGVYWTAYNVTDKIKEGSNTATATTSGDIDGRVYGMVLVAAYNDPTGEEIEYWINEGNENPNHKTPKDTASTAFQGTIDTSSTATLWTAYIASKKGDDDTLTLNGNTIATDAAKADQGSYFDLDSWDVTDKLASSSNTLVFDRGSGTSLHPVIAVLLLTKGAPPGKPDLTVGNLSLPAFIYNNTPSTIKAEIANQGTRSATAFNATLYVDSNPTDTVEIPGLNPGSNTTVEFSWNPPGTGTYLLEVRADPEGEVEESDETNNANSTDAEVVTKNGYFGDKPLTIYRHEKIQGDIIFTLGNSTYSGELANGDSYTVESELKTDATIKLARLYLYWSWSHKEDTGADPEMEVKFNGTTITPEEKYSDSKGFGSFDYPSGTYAYNVTDLVTGKGNYTTTINNTGEGNFAMYGVGLLVVVEDTSTEIEYWLAEGADMLYAKDIPPEQATTQIDFNGPVDLDTVKNATLITVIPGADKGDQDKNKVTFNTHLLGTTDAPSSRQLIAVDRWEVGSHLQPSNNKLAIQDRGDYIVPSNAILILKTKPKLPDLGVTDITPGELSELGIKTVPDSRYGAATGTLFFVVYNKFNQVAGKREAPNIEVYGINATTDPSEWDWTKIKTTSIELKLNLTDPFTHKTQEYLTNVGYYDANDNGQQDTDEERVYITMTHSDGSFALEMEKGRYNIYAKY